MKKESLQKDPLYVELERTISFYPQLSNLFGTESSSDIECAIYFQQLYYWSPRGRRDDGFIYKTKEELSQETSLSRYQQDRCRKKLEKKGILETKLIKVNGVPVLHYKVNVGLVRNLLMGKQETCFSGSKKLTNHYNETENTNRDYIQPPIAPQRGALETSPILSETEPIKPEKKTKKKRDYPPEENKQINELMDLFRKTNPTLKFSRLDHRDACHELIEKFGFDEAKVMCSYAISLSGKQYAPVITTPSKMVDKLADLGAYIQRNGGAISGKIAYENRLSVEKEEEDLLKKYKDSLPRSLKPWHGELKATEENLQEMIAMFRENGVEPTSSRAGDIIILATEGLNTTIPGVISGFKEKKDQIFKTIAEWEEQRAKQAEKDRMIEKSIAEGTYKTTYTR